MEFEFSEEGVPEDFLNGTDKDSNLFGPKESSLPADLQSQLDAYNANFDALNNALGDDSLLNANVATEVRIEKTKEIMVKALPVAVRTVMELANYSLSDSIRLKAATYIIDRVMGKGEVLQTEDAATTLLRKLQGVDSDSSEGR